MSETSSIEDEESRRGELSVDWCEDDLTIREKIAAFVEEYASRPIDQRTGGKLSFTQIRFTRRMIALLRPLLCDELSLSLQDNVDNMETFSGSTTGVFTVVILDDCGFFSEDDATTPDHEDVCTLDDKRCFLSVISQSARLIINFSSRILIDLSSCPAMHFQASFLFISGWIDLPLSEYIGVVSMIQRSVKLKELSLFLDFTDVPQDLCDSLANVIHLQSLHLRPLPTSGCAQVDTFFAKMIAKEDGNGALESLLRNPQNQLKALDFTRALLQDHHVMVLARLLPTCHVEEIRLCDNNIQPPGFLELAKQLPKMHTLTTITLGDNPWGKSSFEERKECGAALLHGLIENPSIDSVDDNCLEYLPQRPLLWHYLCLNRFGRKHLTSSPGQPIPDGLWPSILSLAGKCHDGWEVPHQYNSGANRVHYLLKNFPGLLTRR